MAVPASNPSDAGDAVPMADAGDVPPMADSGPAPMADSEGAPMADSGAQPMESGTMLEASPPQCGGGSATSSDLIVDSNDVRQKISGFGVSTAWNSGLKSPGDADLLWSTTVGAGLSLHRIRIDYRTGQTSEVGIAKLAAARGVAVWAAPWTPPVADKTGGSGDGSIGGTLSNGQAYGAFLAGFVSYMKSQGVSISAVSAQNEPDFNATYESCNYTPASLASFIGTYMGPALAGSGARIMAPETVNCFSFPNYESAILNAPNASQYTTIFATHEYGCEAKAAPELAQAGKEYWETEIYDTVTPADPGMGSALRVAKLIHDAMTVASMNAWHYWWVYTSSSTNDALWDTASGQPSKRLWVEGNYSRFVRPGFVRVGTSGSAPSGVLVSAYQNPLDSSLVVVAVNNNATATPFSVFLSGGGSDGAAAQAPCSVTPWVTSSSDSLVAKPALSVAGSRFSYSLAPQSVTSFVSSGNSTPGGDAGADSGADAAVDGGLAADSGVDGAAEAGLPADSGVDASVDAGPTADSGADAAVDAGLTADSGADGTVDPGLAADSGSGDVDAGLTADSGDDGVGEAGFPADSDDGVGDEGLAAESGDDAGS
jgi:glucuronoarabinoxylan endo-1,4-beta-xylanase